MPLANLANLVNLANLGSLADPSNDNIGGETPDF
jgi:hypothetical protein